jgi:hypothetical protein
MTSIRLIPERRDPPDMERFVAGLLAFAMARLEAEEAEAAERADRKGDDA